MSQDRGDAACDFSGDEGFSPAPTLIVKQDAVAGEEPVPFAIDACHPVGVNLRNRIGATRLERGGFTLRRRSRAKHFRTGGLVKPGLACTAANGRSLVSSGTIVPIRKYTRNPRISRVFCS